MSQLNRTICGHGRIVGDIAFKLTVTSADHSVEEIQEKLLSGDLYACFGDTTLYDENRAVVGSIDWAEHRGNFVVHGVAGNSLSTRAEVLT